MGFSITGVGVVNGLATNVDELDAALRGAGRVANRPADEVPDPIALLHVALDQVHSPLAQARQRWGPQRVAAVVGGEPRLLSSATHAASARGPAFAVTTGRLASAQALVSARALLVSNQADAVLVASAHVDAAPTPNGTPRAEGAACLLLERQAAAELELAHAAESPDPHAFDWELVDAYGGEDTRSAAAFRHRWGDLRPANALTCVVAVAVAMQGGFAPAPQHSTLPVIALESDRVACTAIDGPTHVCITIAARSP